MIKEFPCSAVDSSDSSNVFTFTTGILGFEDTKKYELLFIEDDSPFLFLQAAELSHPSFVVCDPISFVPDYNPNYNDELLSELKAESKDDLRCLAIVTVSENIADITMNLKSPVVLNIKNNFAKQFVMDTPHYSIKHKIFKNDGAANKIC